MYLDFKEIKARVSIEDAANILKLELKKSGNQLRGPCPACGEGDERTLAITPARNLFYCFAAKKGGDCLALVQHITGLDVKDAAEYLSPHTREADHSPAPRQEKQAKKAEFDPAKFEASLAYSAQVAALGLSEDEAKHLGIGEKRGKVYVPIRYPSGVIAGWQYGDFHFPKQLLPDSAANVVQLRRPA